MIFVNHKNHPGVYLLLRRYIYIKIIFLYDERINYDLNT